MLLLLLPEFQLLLQLCMACPQLLVLLLKHAQLLPLRLQAVRMRARVHVRTCAGVLSPVDMRLRVCALHLQKTKGHIPDPDC